MCERQKCSLAAWRDHLCYLILVGMGLSAVSVSMKVMFVCEAASDTKRQMNTGAAEGFTVRTWVINTAILLHWS